jgi:hypothetical protein
LGAVHVLTIRDGDELRLRFEGLRGPKGDPGVCSGPCEPRDGAGTEPPDPPSAAGVPEGTVVMFDDVTSYDLGPLTDKEAKAAGHRGGVQLENPGDAVEIVAFDGARAIKFTIPDRGKAIVNSDSIDVSGGQIVAVGAEVFIPAVSGFNDLSRGWARVADVGSGRKQETRLSTDRSPAAWSVNHKIQGTEFRWGDEDNNPALQVPKGRWFWLEYRLKAGDIGSSQIRPFDPGAAGWWQVIVDGTIVGQQAATTTTGGNLDAFQIGLTISAVPAILYMRNLFAVRVDGPHPGPKADW